MTASVRQPTLAPGPRLPAAYELTERDPISLNTSFDEQYGYRTKSMLVVPMRNHWDDVIGVIQLINCKDSDPTISPEEAYEITLRSGEDFDRLVVPFPSPDEELMEAVAAQAPIALENSRMIEQTEHVFQQFVRASVAAIESRDPPTTGHSERVARMSVALAREVDASATPPFDSVSFNEEELIELEMAALLHDFGKLYVDPSVLTKGTKLYEHEHRYLVLRLDYLRAQLRLEACEKRLEKNTLERQLAFLDELEHTVARLNDPADVKGRNSIPIQAHILMITEVFDALAASDRPYKHALPVATVLDVLKGESDSGEMHPELIELLRSSRAYSCCFPPPNATPGAPRDPT